MARGRVTVDGTRSPQGRPSLEKEDASKAAEVGVPGDEDCVERPGRLQDDSVDEPEVAPAPNRVNLRSLGRYHFSGDGPLWDRPTDGGGTHRPRNPLY